MKHSLNRTVIPTYLLNQLYQESKCPKLKSTLMYTNALMNSHDFDENIPPLPNALFSSIKPKANYERVIRDAKGQFHIPAHAHSKAPICYHINLTLENTNIKPDVVHMPHEDYEIIMVEGNSTHKDKAAKIVYEAIGYTRSFYKNALGIDKMFGFDTHINAVIHFGDSFSNAFWNTQAIYFGDGDNRYFNPLYNDIDIIAHELTHGLITFTTRFFYYAQSGALNESIADIIGIMVKQYANCQTANQSNWLIGENTFIDRNPPKAIRSMSNPGSAYYFSPTINDRQVGHMKDYIDLPLDENHDNGGVHLYSGIPNKAFFLLATELGGYSWNVAGKIWIQTLFDRRLTPQSDFQQFAIANIETAQNMYGSSIANLTKQCWETVGLRFSC